MPGPPPGVGQFLRGQIFQMPPVPVGDLSGRTIVITGANTGLGLEASKHFARLGVEHIVFGVRDLSKGERAKEAVLKSSPRAASAKMTVWPIDMCSYKSVVDFAHRCDGLPRIDALVANAGISVKTYTQAEGDESTLTVNVISTFLLATLMVPKLRQSAAEYGITPTITVTGSAVHFLADTRELKSIPEGKIFQGLSEPKNVNWANRYNLSKLFVTMCVQELAARLKESSEQRGAPFIVVNNVNPGFCRTELFRDDDSAVQRIGLRIIGRTSEQGSRTLVDGIMKGKQSHGMYLSESQIKPASPFAQSEEGLAIQKHLWAELVGKWDRVEPGAASEI